MSLEYPASGEKQDRSVVVQSPGYVDDDTLISALDAFHEMDGPKSCIREVLDWYRGEDAGCLRRSALNVSVENMTCLNALEGESWKIWKSNWNEELVQNSVMNA